MAYDELLAQDIRDAFSGLNFEEKRAFGGLAFMINGKMCVSVNNRPDHIMMVRISENDHEAIERKGAKTAIMRGKEMPGWVFLTKDAIGEEEDFNYWIQLALDFNKVLTQKSK